MAAIAGFLYKFTINGTTATVTDVTGAAGPNPAATTQAWLWQAEKYVIWNDGSSVPVFYDGTTSRRSISSSIQQVTQNGALAVSLTVSGSIGEAVSIQLTTPYQGTNGADGVVNIGNVGQILVNAGQQGNTTISGKNLNMKASANLFGSSGGTPSLTGVFFPAGTPITYFTQTTTIGELPPGRMGVYLMGRNWVCLPDGKQFLASDGNGGSSGTVANDFRDAVLKISENNYLAGGGNFAVPGSFGEIRAMTFVAELDAALGQGPLMVFTPTHVFTCKSPVNRLEWQDVTNPILSMANISSGATGQNSTVQFNSDTIFRSLVGMNSLILARRDFDTWGNVPISREVERVTDLDNETLLPFASAIIFDNRLLMTTRPTSSPLGVFHQGLIALNADPISTLRGKAPSIYDGVWPGLNSLQLLTGEFQLQDRAFAFTLNNNNPNNQTIELWEILKTKDTSIIADNGSNPIFWWWETGSLRWKGETPDSPVYKELWDGELHVDDLQGRVDFNVWWRPDEWPCWIPWITLSECADVVTTGGQPQFRPRIGLGRPPKKFCDTSTNRPFTNAYRFQIKVMITGHCRLIGMRFKAVTIPEPTFAPVNCDAMCGDVIVSI